MTTLDHPWFSEQASLRAAEIRAGAAGLDTDATRAVIDDLIDLNRDIHDRTCINLNPATNVMSPRAEAAMSAGLGSRPSLGHPGEKYEMGLEAIEQLEVITHDLACRVFDARYAEIRVGSGALANLYAFMVACQPGDPVIVPPPSIGGHVTHNTAGVAGLYGLDIHEAPIDPTTYSVDIDGVRELAHRVRPKLISVGSSLNLAPHPVAELRAVADEVGAMLLFDAAHLCGMIAGRQWANPLAEGAHLMTMSTYKSLGGPAGGLVVTDDAAVAARLDAIAYPGMTANFDAGRTTALAFTLLDWLDFGVDYGNEMVATARALADTLLAAGHPVFDLDGVSTLSHQFAIRADGGPDQVFSGGGHGGHGLALRLREANLLACAIGLPNGDGLRIGTPEIVRWGMTVDDMAPLADLIGRALLDDPMTVAADVTDFRSRFTDLRFCR